MIVDEFTRSDAYTNCTVQVLTNTETGETSIGWTQDIAIAENIIRQSETVNGG